MSALQPLAEAAGGFSGLLEALVHYVVAPLITLISCLLSIFVVLGNLLVVTAIWHENQLHTVTNYLIASLAAADCLVGALVMPFNIISEIILGSWTFGPTWCDLWHSFDVLASTASIMNLCAISLDRYLAITNPISYPTKMTPKRVAFLIVSIWTCSSLISFPAIFWWRAVSPGGPLREINTSAPERHRNLTMASLNSNTQQQQQRDSHSAAAATLSSTISNSLSEQQQQPPEAATFPLSSSALEAEVQRHFQAAGVDYKCVFTDDTYYLLFSSFVSFYGPLCVMLYAYYCIYRAAVQQTRFLKYGSKQVMVRGGGGSRAGGGKRQRHVSELSSSSNRKEKWNGSEQNSAGYSQNNSHDRQRLVLRVHRGGGGGAAANALASVSNSSHKSTSDTSNQNHASSTKPVQKRNKEISSATKLAGSKKCDIKSAAGGHSPAASIDNGDTSNRPNGSAARFALTRHSRRDELRVRSQRFDSSSSSSVPTVASSPVIRQQVVAASGGSHNSLPLLRQQSGLKEAQVKAEAEQAAATSCDGLLEQRSATIGSDTSTDSRGSIVTVEARGLDEDLNGAVATGHKLLSSESAKSNLKQDLLNSPAQPAQAPNASSCETDELLVKTRDALNRFNRTVSLESALERKLKRTPIQVTINLSGAQIAATTAKGPGKLAANSIGARQAALAHQDSDKLIRSIVDLNAIHYIDCTNQSYGISRPATINQPSRGRRSSAATKIVSENRPLAGQMAAGTANVVTVKGVRSQRVLGKTMSQLEPSSRLATYHLSSASPANSLAGSGSAAASSAPDQQQQQQQQQQNGKKLTKLAKERKAAKTLGIVVGVFILCWLPFFVVNIMVAACGAACIYKPDLLFAIVTWLGWLNSAMNPVIYACWSRDFRRAFRKTLCTWVEFVCYDGAAVARRLKLKKGSNYMNTQEALLGKQSGVSVSKCATGSVAANAAGQSNSCRSAVSIEIDNCSRNHSSDV